MCNGTSALFIALDRPPSHRKVCPWPATEYKRARARAAEALEKLHDAKGYLEAKRIYKNELTPAIEALLAAKLALLRVPSEPDEPKKTIKLSDRYFK